jgi:hypothetical protein
MGRKQKLVLPNFSDLDRDEVIWAAGFFDGEGNVSVSLQREHYPRISVQITQVHPEVLQRFRDAVGGLGTIQGPYEYRGKVNGQPWYIYKTNAPQEVMFVISALRPFVCSVKRAQGEEKVKLYLSLRDDAGLPASPQGMTDLTPTQEVNFYLCKRGES